jgi:hypothetical protein
MIMSSNSNNKQYPDDERSRDEVVFNLIKRRYDSELARINDLDDWSAGSRRR